jgi:hypothetical protein
VSEARRGSDAAAGRQAPGSLEQRLVEAFREHHAWRRMQRRRAWRGLAAALPIAAALGVISFLRLSPKEVRPVAAVRATVLTKVAPIPPTPATVARKVPRRRRSLPAIREAEVTTGFLPLDAAGYPPGGGEVIRVEMPRSTMALFGLPVNQERASVPVRADVLFGEDGMAHAVRFVTTTSYEIQTER